MSQPAALCGAGFGTLFYIYVTKKRSPVFLGSSFAFISPLIGATAFGYLGIFVGAIFAGLVYTIIALIIKKTGSGWVNKLLPPVVIGPTVSLIGLSLSTSAISNLTNTASSVANYNILHILVGVFAFLVTIWASIKGPKWMRMIPFIIGIGAAYIVGLILTFCGLPIINVAAFDNMQFFKLPEFTFLGMFSGKGDNTIKSFSDVLNLFMLFAPVAFVTLAEHIADHKNLSSIVGRDLITDPAPKYTPARRVPPPDTVNLRCAPCAPMGRASISLPSDRNTGSGLSQPVGSSAVSARTVLSVSSLRSASRSYSFVGMYASSAMFSNR